MTPDEKTLHFIIAYAGSDAGNAARESLLAELVRLRRVEDAARDVVNVALNDAGPAAFETMAQMRALLSNSTTKEGP